MSIAGIPMVAGLLPVERLSPPVVRPTAPQPVGPTFSDLVLDGIQDLSTKALTADNMARAFAVDDSVPVHQVTFALEQARLQLELAMQVRGRLVEAYQQLMNMQL